MVLARALASALVQVPAVPQGVALEPLLQFRALSPLLFELLALFLEFVGFFGKLLSSIVEP